MSIASIIEHLPLLSGGFASRCFFVSWYSGGMSRPSRKIRVAIITCFSQPDYVRSLTLRAALASDPGLEVIVIKNKRRGMARYPEIWWKIVRARVRMHPDVYLLTFRGQEVLPFLLALAWPRPVLFDEFVVPLAMHKEEGYRRTPTVVVHHALVQMTAGLYKRWLKRCQTILTDTDADADASAALSGTPRSKYVALPVGAEEAMFRPEPAKPARTSQPFQVFFCGNMKPLYGLRYVLDAAQALQDQAITFHIVGGDTRDAQDVAAAVKRGARITYQPWLPFAEFPQAMHQADLCLGGPFGNTGQAQRVITGKTYQILACAAPVLVGSSKATGAFTDKQDCLLVPQANAAALAQTIRWARDHPKELQAIGQAGRQLYEREFSVQTIARRLNPVVHSAAER